MNSKKLIWGLVVFAASSAITALCVNTFMKNQSPYHDTVLAQHLICSHEWIEIDLENRVQIEGDSEMIGVKFRDGFEIDIDGDGGIKDQLGSSISPEIFIVDSRLESYQLFFAGARGNRLANYRPKTPLPPNRTYEKLRIRCDRAIETDSIIWTTYSHRDLK